MTTDATNTPKPRTHRPKQRENALPDPATKPRYCCAHAKGEPADAPHRVIVVDSVRWDITRGDKGDHRIGYYNEATGRRGESWYASFKSGAEFWPAPPVVVRRELPAPWKWWDGHQSYLAKVDDSFRAIACASAKGFDVYLSEDSSVFESFTATSLEDARGRAEDECWARGLLAVRDPQPVASTPTFATAPASHPTAQLPLTLAVHPVDGARALALLERLTVAAEAIAFHMSSPLRDAVPHKGDDAKPANANAA